MFLCKILRPCLAGLHGRLHERLRPKPCQTVVLAPASSLELRLEHLAAYTGKEKPQNRGFVRLRGAAALFAPRTQHRGGRAPPLDACRWWSRVGGGPRRRDLRGGGGRPRQPEPQRGCGPGDPPPPPEQDEEAEDAVTPRPTRGAGRIGRRRWPAAARSARPVGSRSDGGGGGFGRLGRRRATG